ncbi:hypothetical protein JYU34_022869, partial [Plutella xylostella]
MSVIVTSPAISGGACDPITFIFSASRRITAPWLPPRPPSRRPAHYIGAVPAADNF